MRLDDFCTALPALWDGDPATAEYPRDRRFRALLREIGGQAVENKLAVLNLAAQFLSPSEMYLEAGAFRGVSICAAALGNPTQRFITVDNFSEFGGPDEECQANIGRWTSGNVALVDSSIWTYLPTLTAPVGVWFYDARHEWSDQWRALAAIEPYLADEALVIVDDARWREVGTADTAFVAAHPRFDFVARYPSPQDSDPYWWNGLDVIAFRRIRGAADPAVMRRARMRPFLIYGVAWRAYARSLHHARHALWALPHPKLRHRPATSSNM